MTGIGDDQALEVRRSICWPLMDMLGEVTAKKKTPPGTLAGFSCFWSGANA